MRKSYFTGTMLIVLALFTSCSHDVIITGNLNKWQPVTLTINGPEVTEQSSTFRDYRLNVTFSNGDKSYTVPGYFAADGNAAHTSASTGNIWRVIFSPDAIGTWKYKVSFRKGANIAASNELNAGEPLDIDGTSGLFQIKEVAPDAKGCFAKGKLLYVGERYLQYSETKEWFVKAGPGGPENFLGYADFDSTYNVPGGVDTDSMLGENRLHEYEPHLKDWKTGDPTWKDGKGKAIIGAVNYLASMGLNNLYMVINGVEGDGRDCWPWASYNDRDVYDVSKLAQWEIVFNHLNQKGIEIDFLFWEAENDKLLNNGDMGLERKIYYRELIARFGYLPAIRWNLGEEPQISSEQLIANGEFIKSIDPYGTAVGLECSYKEDIREHEYFPLLGNQNIDGAWMQVHKNHHQEVLKYIKASDDAQHKWVVGIDESEPIYTTSIDKARTIFWQIVTAGGEGFDIYFGYGGGTCDIANEDFRNRDTIWAHLSIGLKLFQTPAINVVLPEMRSADELGNGYILSKPGEMYIIYIKNKLATLDLSGVEGDFNILWLDPINGGDMKTGDTQSVSGGQMVELGNPPVDGDEWLIWITKQ